MIVSVDGLTGFGDAIHAVFPLAEIQRCIVHQIRYSTFPTDDALFKMLYLAMMDATKKWTGKTWDWGLTLDRLCIYFADRITPEDLY